MSTAEQNKLKLAYEGSVKRVWQCPWEKDALLFQFTDDYSVFDWGKMPDTIENKGRALAVFGAYFFELLEKPRFWQELSKQNAPDNLDKDYLQGLPQGKLMKSLQTNGLESHFLGLVKESGERLGLSEAAASQESIYMQVRKAEVQRPQPLVVLGQNISIILL